MTSEDKTKLRPYLTVTQIRALINLLSTETNRTVPEYNRIRTSLASVILKYDAELVSGSYVSTPRETIESKLGIPDTSFNLLETKYLNGEMTPEEEEVYLNKLLGAQ